MVSSRVPPSGAVREKQVFSKSKNFPQEKMVGLFRVREASKSQQRETKQNNWTIHGKTSWHNGQNKQKTKQNITNH